MPARPEAVVLVELAGRYEGLLMVVLVTVRARRIRLRDHHGGAAGHETGRAGHRCHCEARS